MRPGTLLGQPRGIASIWVLGLLILSGCAAPIYDPQRFVYRWAIYQQIARPSVKLEGSCGSSGSGTVIYQDGKKAIILTAYHVVGQNHSGCGWAALQTDPVDGTFLIADAVFIGGDAALDLALVQTKPIWHTVAYLPTWRLAQSVGIYTRLYAYGFPLGINTGNLTMGEVTDLDNEGFLRHNTPTFFGNSGGGMFVHRDGHYILISVSQMVVPQFVQLGRGALPVNMIHFLEQNNIL